MKEGFTLIELIVVVAIVALIASIALANFPSFRGRLTLDREAGNLALALRKVQQYSSGVRRFEGEIAMPAAACVAIYNAQYPAYGVAVSMDNLSDYSIYADPDCDRVSASYLNDMVESMSFENGVQIFDICTDIDSALPTCGVAKKLDVWYIRPSPTLLLTVDGSPQSSLQSAKIILKVQDGSKKSVVIRKTGQISIQDEK